MPELPEVETVRRGLEPRLVGRTLERVEILDWRLTDPEDPTIVGMELDGDRVVAIGRRGKYLLFALGSGRTLVVHLRMTGWFHHQAAGAPVPEVRHLRARVTLDDGALVLYSDQRRFGTMRLIEPGGLDAYLARRAGPEPLSPGGAGRICATRSRAARRRSRRCCSTSRSWPGSATSTPTRRCGRRASTPSGSRDRCAPPRSSALHAAVIAVLERGIAAQGATIRDYRGADGAGGSMQERFNVYGREGEPCPRCGTPIAKIRVAGRGTHFCPHCTRRPGYVGPGWRGRTRRRRWCCARSGSPRPTGCCTCTRRAAAA